MSTLSHLTPQLIWEHFEQLCAIPRPSKHEEKAAEYVKKVAEDLSLEVQTDATGNVLVKKAASKGFENHPTVILQCHLDMVPQKNESITHDFLTDPIVPIIDGAWVKAQGTTLGADNGIGVAIALAILESSDLVHGPLEVLFTIDEETGMTGALALQPGFLKGALLINLDTEQEDELCIGCAGGLDAKAQFTLSYEKVPDNMHSFSIAVKGLAGGHSGIDIHLGRANAIKLLNHFLFVSSKKFGIRIGSIHGGSVRNAIPREAFSTIAVPKIFVSEFISFAREFEYMSKMRLAGADPGMYICIEESVSPQNVFTHHIQDLILQSIYACPNGVFRMSDKVEGVVETSNNIAIIECNDQALSAHCLLRSSVEFARDDLANAVHCAFSLGGAQVSFTGGYPGWEPDPSSELLNVMKRVYKEKNGREASIIVVHAGLECGIIGASHPGLQMVSCGPTIKFPHSPDECVEIASVERFWNFITHVLQQL